MSAGSPQRILESKFEELTVALRKHLFRSLAKYVDKVVAFCDCLDEVLIELSDRVSHSVDSFDSFDKEDKDDIYLRA